METQDKKEKIKEITEELHQGIKNLFESNKYKTYLQTMSKFTNYSFNNSLLIALQRPETMAVAGYRAWESKFDRHVKKGAKGIAIIEPAPYKKKVQEVVKDENGKPMVDELGKEIMQEVERVCEGYKVGYVFAFEDTYGAPLPEIVSILNEKVDNYETMMDVLKKISPVPICFEEIHSGANGYYHLETRSIHIDSRLPELQAIKTTIHEMAHCLLHDKVIGEDMEATKFEREVCAESVAYTVASYLGLDTSEYSFGYIGGWSANKELKELQQKMELIRKTANVVITDIEKELMTRKMDETEEVAFKNGTGYLLIQKSDEGFEYEKFDIKFNSITKSVFDDKQCSMNEAIDKIMEVTETSRSLWSLYDANTLKEKTCNLEKQAEEKEKSINSYDKPLKLSRR